MILLSFHCFHMNYHLFHIERFIQIKLLSNNSVPYKEICLILYCIGKNDMFSLSYLDDKQQFIMLVAGIHKNPYHTPRFKKKKNNDKNNNNNNNDKRYTNTHTYFMVETQNDAQNNFTVRFGHVNINFYQSLS